MLKEFDVVLILGYFRSAASYLSIIRYLSPELRVGLVPACSDASLKKKTGAAEGVFLRWCEDNGAEIVQPTDEVRARLMVVQQFSYSDEMARQIRRNVKATRRIGLMALATAGLDVHDRFLGQFDVAKVLVPSQRFMEFLLRNRRATERYATVEVEEVGLPFRRYPVFPEVRVDWIVATPTLFSFSTEDQKQTFLRTVLRLLSQIPPDDVVAYKSHNGSVLDYFAPRFHYAAASVYQSLPAAGGLLERICGLVPRPLSRELKRVVTSGLHQEVLRRATALPGLTAYADLSLEAFLPGVQKGVIGGLSNTIWGTLYFGLPFYNCVDPTLVLHSTSELLNKNSESLLKLNMEYFGVPFCHGELSKGARGEAIVREEDRQGDLLMAIRRELGR